MYECLKHEELFTRDPGTWEINYRHDLDICRIHMDATIYDLLLSSSPAGEQGGYLEQEELLEGGVHMLGGHQSHQ